MTTVEVSSAVVLALASGVVVVVAAASVVVSAVSCPTGRRQGLRVLGV